MSLKYLVLLAGGDDDGLQERPEDLPHSHLPGNGFSFDKPNVQRFPGGLVFKALRLCVSLNSRLESNKEEKNKKPNGFSVDEIR